MEEIFETISKICSWRDVVIISEKFGYTKIFHTFGSLTWIPENFQQIWCPIASSYLSIEVNAPNLFEIFDDWQNFGIGLYVITTRHLSNSRVMDMITSLVPTMTSINEIKSSEESVMNKNKLNDVQQNQEKIINSYYTLTIKIFMFMKKFYDLWLIVIWWWWGICYEFLLLINVFLHYLIIKSVRKFGNAMKIRSNVIFFCVPNCEHFVS